MTIPTALTILRLILTGIILALLFRGGDDILCLLLFSAAAWTDYFDGAIARRTNQVTKLGATLDTAVDKIFVYLLLFALYERGVYVALFVLAAFLRDACVESVRLMSVHEHRIIPANRWGKTKFVLQCLSIFVGIAERAVLPSDRVSITANALLLAAFVASVPGVFAVWRSFRH